MKKMTQLLMLFALTGLFPCNFIYSENTTKNIGKYLRKPFPTLTALEFDTGQLTGNRRLFKLSFSPDVQKLFFATDSRNPISGFLLRL